MEQILNSKVQPFSKKVEAIIEVWKKVHKYSVADDILYVVQLLDWAKFHTLNIILNGDWKNQKGKLYIYSYYSHAVSLFNSCNVFIFYNNLIYVRNLLVARRMFVL